MIKITLRKGGRGQIGIGRGSQNSRKIVNKKIVMIKKGTNKTRKGAMLKEDH
jgi:hypothetical protein